MSTFLLTRNQYASGPIAHAMGIYLAATQAHIDVKRLLSRVGLSISDTSAHAALRSMTQSSLSSLKETISNAHRRGEELYCLVIDNIQEYYMVREEGIGMQSELRQGTHGTAVRLEDCQEDAFSLQDYLSRLWPLLW